MGGRGLVFRAAIVMLNICIFPIDTNFGDPRHHLPPSV